MTTKELYESMQKVGPFKELRVSHVLQNGNLLDPEYWGVEFDGEHFFSNTSESPDPEKLLQTVLASLPTPEQKLYRARKQLEAARVLAAQQAEEVNRLESEVAGKASQ